MERSEAGGKEGLRALLSDAYQYARAHLGEGRVATYIPELARANPANLGVYMITADGEGLGVGDYDIPFTAQSIGKTFALLLALQTAGEEAVFSKVGMEPSGDSFDSIIQLEMKNWNPYNPLINCGAIATVGCIRAEDPFQEYLELARKLCGDPEVSLNEKVYFSEKKTGNRNRAIAYLLKSDRILEDSAEEVLDLYFRMCSVMVTAKDLANYAYILSNGGRDPRTGEQLLDFHLVRTLLTLMLLCGMYDESGEYAVRVGIPSKSGVGGGIVAVPGNGSGIGTYGPVLNKKGNSVGGERIMEYLSRKMDLHIIRNHIV